MLKTYIYMFLTCETRIKQMLMNPSHSLSALLQEVITVLNFGFIIEVLAF